CGSPDLPAPRRHPAGPGAGSGPDGGANGRTVGGPARSTLPAPDWWESGDTASAANAPRHTGLELRPAERVRAPPVQPAVGVRWWLDPGGCRGDLRGPRDHAGGRAGPAVAVGQEIAGRRARRERWCRAVPVA